MKGYIASSQVVQKDLRLCTYSKHALIVQDRSKKLADYQGDHVGRKKMNFFSIHKHFVLAVSRLPAEHYLRSGSLWTT